MASVKTDLGYIHGTENLVDWVNKNADTHQIKNQADLYYWVKLAKQKKKEGSRCLTLTASESKDAKKHILPFCILRGDNSISLMSRLNASTINLCPSCLSPCNAYCKLIEKFIF